MARWSALCTLILPSAAVASWPGTAADVQTFLTFDYRISSEEIRSSKVAYNFVWGAAPEKVADYRASASKDAVLSYYHGFSRDENETLVHNCSGPSREQCGALRWYEAHRPGWTLFTCDRKTPSWLTFAGEPWSETAMIPLDVTNPDVFEWQVQTIVKTAVRLGYDAMAWDNFDLGNAYKACGVWRDGEWVQLYSGEQDDPAYAEAMVKWSEAMRVRVNAATSLRGQPMLSVPNWALDPGQAWDAPLVLRMGNATDGSLDEAGFSSYGCAEVAGCTTGEAWVNKLRWARNLQAAGNGYFMINEVGDLHNVSAWNLPCAQDPLNCITRAKRLYLLASYLLAKGGTSALFVSNIQLYGGFPACPECTDCPIGEPLSDPKLVGGLWRREFSHGLVLLNAEPSPDRRNASLGSECYVDLAGGRVQGVQLPGGNATVLLKCSRE